MCDMEKLLQEIDDIVNDNLLFDRLCALVLLSSIPFLAVLIWIIDHLWMVPYFL